MDHMQFGYTFGRIRKSLGAMRSANVCEVLCNLDEQTFDDLMKASKSSNFRSATQNDIGEALEFFREEAEANGEEASNQKNLFSDEN